VSSAADSYFESAATSIAAAGQPPTPREREPQYTRSRSKKRSPGGAAPRVRHYEAGPATRGTRAHREGARCERRHAARPGEHSTRPESVTTGSANPASPLVRAVRRLRRVVQGPTTVKSGSEHRRGDCATPCLGWCLACVIERDSDRLAARHARLHGRRLSAPTPGTSVLLPGPFGPLMMAMSHRREAI
jgi:hypothetical protein